MNIKAQDATQDCPTRIMATPWLGTANPSPLMGQVRYFRAGAKDGVLEPMTDAEVQALFASGRIERVIVSNAQVTNQSSGDGGEGEDIR